MTIEHIQIIISFGAGVILALVTLGLIRFSIHTMAVYRYKGVVARRDEEIGKNNSLREVIGDQDKTIIDKEKVIQDYRARLIACKRILNEYKNNGGLKITVEK